MDEAAAASRGQPFFEYLSEPSRKAVVIAEAEAVRSGSAEITTAHLLVALCRLDEGVAADALREAGVSAERLRTAIEDSAPAEPESMTRKPRFSTGTKAALQQSMQLAAEQGDGFVSSEHLLLALCDRADQTLRDLVEQDGLSLADLRGDTVALAFRSSRPEAWIWPWPLEGP